MSKTNFMVVIDTTESTTIRGLPRGILNTYIVKAVNEKQAADMILRTMRRDIAIQIQNSLFVYDLDTILYNIDIADKNRKTLPLFSFNPLNGTRPPKILNLIPKPTNFDSLPTEHPVYPTTTTTTEPTSVVEPEVEQKELSEKDINFRDPNVRQQPKTSVYVPPITNPRAGRTADFQRPDHVPQGVVKNDLPPDKEEIIRRLGANPNQYGSNEGVNPRINASTGQNLDLSRASAPPESNNTLTREQVDILSKIGALNKPVVVEEPEYSVEDEQRAAFLAANRELAEINPSDGILTEEQIAQLQKELDEK